MTPPIPEDLPRGPGANLALPGVQLLRLLCRAELQRAVALRRVHQVVHKLQEENMARSASVRCARALAAVELAASMAGHREMTFTALPLRSCLTQAANAFRKSSNEACPHEAADSEALQALDYGASRPGQAVAFKGTGGLNFLTRSHSGVLSHQDGAFQCTLTVHACLLRPELVEALLKKFILSLKEPGRRMKRAFSVRWAAEGSSSSV